MAFSLTNTANANSTADASSYTFSSQSLGAVAGTDETRYNPVAVGCFVNSGEVTALTVGGVSAAEQTQLTDASNGPAGIFNAAVPTGTTGDVVVTVSGKGVAISVYRMIDPLALTAGAVTEDPTHASGVLDLDIEIPTGGGAIGCVTSTNAGTTTWVGLTETYDVDIDTLEFVSTAFGTTAGSPRTITATNADTTPKSYLGCSASWGPALFALYISPVTPEPRHLASMIAY